MTMLNPPTVAAPSGPYSHGIETPPGARWLHIAGQVGVTPDGKVPADFAAQADQCWRNIKAILAAAGMGVEHLVKVNHYLTKHENIPGYGAVRSKVLGNARPASTMVVISSLVKPEWLVEVEAIAAK